jgi:hypothetical protein
MEYYWGLKQALQYLEETFPQLLPEKEEKMEEDED